MVPPGLTSCGVTRTPHDLDLACPEAVVLELGVRVRAPTLGLERHRAALGLDPHRALVRLEDLVRVALRLHPSAGEPDGPPAQLANLALVV